MRQTLFRVPSPDYVLYLAIPAQNEVATIGVLLWRLRTVLAEFPREYEVVVYDDASEDETADVAEQYAHAMPVTVIRGAKPVGYAGAVDALVRHVSGHTRYPRRDAMLLLQGDFTDPPGIVPEFARRFEGGADIVVGERTAVVDAPKVVTRLFSAAGWALRPFVKIDGVRDLTSSMRLVRISVLRDLLRTVGDAPVCAGDSWTANADLLLHLVPHARRVESVPMEPTYGVRMRETRRVIVRDALAALRWGWRARGRRAVPSTVPESTADASARPARGATQPKRRDEPEMTAERLRERKKDRERPRTDSGLEDAAEQSRRERGRTRDRRIAPDAPNALAAAAESPDSERLAGAGAQPERSTAGAEARPSRESRGVAEERSRKRADAGDARSGDARAEVKSDRSAKPRREPRRARDADGLVSAASEDILDDPFASPNRAAVARATPTAPRPSSTPSASPANAAADSPYADEPVVAPTSSEATPPAETAKTGRGAEGGDVVSPRRPPASNGEPGAASDVDQDDADDADAEDGDTDSAETSESDIAGDGTDAGAKARKRRRNRRSRRRKGRSVAAEGDPAVVHGGPTGDDADVPHVGRDDADSSDDEAAGDDSGDDSGAGGDGTSDGSADDVSDQSRAKRRGRRGRRGGARRSRKRERDSENATDSASDRAEGSSNHDSNRGGGEPPASDGN